MRAAHCGHALVVCAMRCCVAASAAACLRPATRSSYSAHVSCSCQAAWCCTHCRKPQAPQAKIGLSVRWSWPEEQVRERHQWKDGSVLRDATREGWSDLGERE